ncbi:MAG TPA: Tol-Pal system beta propeller repeat protein TolB [Paracoccus sp. (in: a-proteobacteria)]|uniref:Tol-Pal system beta propeller repeat protein TolB n=1 Tax=Paracoccus sp. TaxID=267 RepID=UPI002CFD301A|nr:Tol-Pal system beta propeller repeat protein TolB [Paracoccus sp. (in: a-proteobacteria)]HWL55143.1 Tol-Pal system beta propeller repeat protein TolB [Paracoccus sp. (in: a-proteobacteria)]
MLRRLFLTSALALAGLGLAAPVLAQDGPLRIEITDGVIEPMPFAIAKFHDEGGAGEYLSQVQNLIAADLTGTGLFREIPASAHIARPEGFESPVSYEDWKAINAQALITGAVRVEGGKVIVKFRLFDVFAGQPLGDGMQFDASTGNWRRAAHKAADQVYARLTGEGPYFDSRVAFVQESGPKDARRKRIGIMDYDGANVKFLTDDSTLVLKPRYAPDGSRLLYTSYASGFPQAMLMDVNSLSVRALGGEQGTMSFSPRFSPDGRWIVYSLEKGGNTDIYQMDAASGAQRALTNSPSIETSPSFSPDGSQIVFESDRSGVPQLYIMSANGGEAKRISFGEGRYGTPVWSPRGDMIAFTRQVGPKFHIGVMRTDGSEEKMLTESFLDEGPSWAPNGRVVMFTRVTPGGNGEPRLHSVDITGRNMRPVKLNGAASDPDWGPLLP